MNNILLLSPLPPPIGGIATWTKEIISANEVLNLNNIEVINTAVRGRSITNASIFSRIFFGLVQFVFICARLIGCLIFKKVDVVHLCSSGDYGLSRDIIYLILIRVFNRNSVLHLHRGKVPDYNVMFSGGGIEKWLSILGCKLADGVIVLNAGALSTLSKYCNKIEIIPNFIGDWKFNYNLKSRNLFDRSIVFVGHVIKRKGVFELLDASIKLFENGCLDKLIFVGPCEFSIRQELNLKISSNNLDDFIYFAGPCAPEKVTQILRASYLFCLPSYAEGLPFVILEAMASGTPIVSTTVSGIPSVLSDGCGVCVEPGSVDELFNALSHFLNNPELADVVASRARDRCFKFYSATSVYHRLNQFWRF